MNVRNLPEIRSKDPKLHEALQDIIRAISTTAQQVNANPDGPAQPPPQVNAIKVSGANGRFHVAITDQNSQLSRGVSYFVEHADNPQFTNPITVEVGASRNLDLSLGNVTRYFRAYSSYSTSDPSAPVYHGGSASPVPVSGGGASGGPDFLPSEGSGTGIQGEGLSGFGPVPKR